MTLSEVILVLGFLICKMGLLKISTLQGDFKEKSDVHFFHARQLLCSGMTLASMLKDYCYWASMTRIHFWGSIPDRLHASQTP